MVNEKMKKIISGIIALSVFLSCIVISSAVEKGDVDRDGSIKANDARMVLRFSVELEIPTEEDIAIGDINGDGKLTAYDARSILRISVGLPVDSDTTSQPDNTYTPSFKAPADTHVPSERELKLRTILYEKGHSYLGKHKPAFDNAIMKNFQKWCCVYTIHDVFQPALEEAGYSQAEINKLAPNKFSRETYAKAISGFLGTKYPPFLAYELLDVYVPSIFANYYINNPDVADVFFLYDFYDDIVEQKLYERNQADVERYSPRVGDILFMTNITKTNDEGYLTVDHTAQIVKVYDDGTFLCTEGSLLDASETDGLARVRERRYAYYDKTGTYVYVNGINVVVLFAAQLKL